MKTFMFNIMLAALTAGLATAGGGYRGGCANSNSKACRDAREAFADHHGGAYPRQYDQWHAYNNNRNYWNEYEERGHERRHEEHREHHEHHDHE